MVGSRLTSRVAVLAALLICVMIASEGFPPALAIAPDSASPPALTFHERVAAQRAIERVYYSHRLGTSQSFDRAVPTDFLEKKVHNYLKQTLALEEFWHTPVTSAALRRELERITANSRFPERLAEIRAALNGDERLMMETLARSVLVDRLARAFLANDTRVQGPAGREGVEVTWDEWWAGASRRFDESSVIKTLPGAPEHETHSAAVTAFSQLTADCSLQDLWTEGHTEALPSPRSEHTSVWTGSEMIIWGGREVSNYLLRSGGRYDPTTDTWTGMSVINAPTPRQSHTAVWTGADMVVWGGDLGGAEANTGGRYDPTSDSWQPTSIVNAPSARYRHTAVWTGTRMIIWGGGISQTNTGGLYDPTTDTWTATSIVGAPTARIGHSAVWAGDVMIVWGGNFTNTGGRYNPSTDTWVATSTVGAPTEREWHTAVWTGSRMIIWGSGGGFLPTGGRYDPVTDEWTPMSQTGAASNRSGHTAVWTGSELVVWGGDDRSQNPSLGRLNTGARYNPDLDSWLATTIVNAPSIRSGHQAVWADGLMLVWGGTTTSTGGRYHPASNTWTPTHSTRKSLYPQWGRSSVWTGTELILWGGGTSTGAKYDAITDSWAPMTTLNAPAARENAPAVWTGTEMIVWSAGDNSPATNTGGRYNPAGDTWAPTSLVNAPSPRLWPTAIWSGSEMIVYGGTSDRTGGRYNPSTDTWSPTSTINAPDPAYPTAVWTGSGMIVWGGSSGGTTNTGARYDPVSDTWQPTSTLDAPSPRTYHTAIWTGSRMIIWGGYGTSQTNTGGLYDPATDTWTPTSLVNAPIGRTMHTAVWTGSEMIVWGGSDNSQLFYTYSVNTGGRYEPTLDTWTPTTTTDAPVRRSEHVAVWTGQSMIVWGGMDYHGDVVSAIDDRNVRWYGNTNAAPNDSDGDDVGECTDCDDASAAAWSSPGEVSDLEFSADGQTLSWQAPGIVGGVGISYDTLRSTTSADFAGPAAVCIESLDSADTIATDPEIPPPGGIFSYLVRARNSCPWPSGMGSAGSDSSGAVRAARTCP